MSVFTGALFMQEHSPVETLDVLSDAAPAFADIDDDGDLDLFIGNIAGHIRFYRNDGSVTLFRSVLQLLNSQNIFIGQNAFLTFAAMAT